MNAEIEKILVEKGISLSLFNLLVENSVFYKEYPDGFIVVYPVAEDLDYLSIETTRDNLPIYMLRDLKKYLDNIEVPTAAQLTGNYEKTVPFAERLGAKWFPKYKTVVKYPEGDK